MRHLQSIFQYAARRHGRSLGHRALAVLLSTLALLPLACAADTGTTASGLADLSLKELADLPITSVSKKPEPLADAAASVYVITGDAIRRSGATSLPEALRLAPNLQVAQESANAWAISARGADATSADKLLVLIDGRIVYTPLFSGVFWDIQNLVLADVERIEVISGPGGTLWGTNAVNGVINIITRKAADTTGTLASAGGGRYSADADARYGSELGDGGAYRVYAKMSDRYDTTTGTGANADDQWNIAQAGFRSDWAAEQRRFTLQGDAYRGGEDSPTTARNSMSGFNVLGHADETLSGGSDVSLLAYIDQTKRYVPLDYGETLGIADVELQQTLPPIWSQDFVWGASYRYADDAVQDLPGSTLAFLPPEVHQSWSALFAQDQAHLSSDWRLILGARLEHNPYTGTEFLPNARLAWNLSEDSLLWTSVSREVRAPSRIDGQSFVPEKPPFALVGNPDFQSETARVYELGYRITPATDWSFSVTGYHYNYFHLRSEDLISAFPLQLQFGNEMAGSETGAELWGSYQPLSNWRLSAGLNTLRESRALSGTALPGSVSLEGEDPAAEWQLRSSYDFEGGEELDVSVRHVAALPYLPTPAYTVGDLRLGWNFGPRLECSLLAQNLFGPPHVEFNNGVPATEFGRGLYFKLTWRQ